MADFTQEIECDASPESGARLALAKARSVLVITGSGISAESGVPTFRGQGGIWEDGGILAELSQAKGGEELLAIGWKWCLRYRQLASACRPNVAHTALAAWAKARQGVTLVTQNVDGLHERAGQTDAIRIHGSLWHNRCLECGRERPDESLILEHVPLSPCCNAVERPAVVMFDEQLPDLAHAKLVRAFMEAEALLVIGTSGKVAPICDFINMACSVLNKTVVNVNLHDPDAYPAAFRLAGKASVLVPRLVG